jgi:hypothetical protein
LAALYPDSPRARPSLCPHTDKPCSYQGDQGRVILRGVSPHDHKKVIMGETITMAKILLIPELWVTAEIAIKDGTLYQYNDHPA